MDGGIGFKHAIARIFEWEDTLKPILSNSNSTMMVICCSNVKREEATNLSPAVLNSLHFRRPQNYYICKKKSRLSKTTFESFQGKMCPKSFVFIKKWPLFINHTQIGKPPGIGGKVPPLYKEILFSEKGNYIKRDALRAHEHTWEEPATEFAATMFTAGAMKRPR